MNCEILTFSDKLSQERIARIEALLGKKAVVKILAFALFLLGVDRALISSFLNMPPGSLRSLILAINKRGLAAFEDQRIKSSSFKKPLPHHITPTLHTDNLLLTIDFRPCNLIIRIPNSNPVQKKVILLSLLNSNILTTSEVATALHLSPDRIGKLSRKLHKGDVESILDKRRGQRQDYRFTPEIKAELIQQFVIEAVNHRPTSGEQLAKKLMERCQLTVSPRSILNHIAGLGLTTIRDSISEYLSEVKKKPSDS